MHFLWLTHITGSLNLLLLTTVLTFWTHSAVASFFPLSITCLPWGQMEDMVLGTDRRHLFFSILSPLLQTCHFHRTHSHQYSYYLTVSGGTYVCLKNVLVVPLYCGENTKWVASVMQMTLIIRSPVSWISLWEIPTMARLSWNIIWSSKVPDSRPLNLDNQNCKHSNALPSV